MMQIDLADQKLSNDATATYLDIKPDDHENTSSHSKYMRIYLNQSMRIWKHLPESVRSTSAGYAFGRHLHRLICLSAERRQYFATFFLRNRPELELMRYLVSGKPNGSTLKISVLACSKGAEVYSTLWAIRSARPDLKVIAHAVDISKEILAFAENGVYSHEGLDAERRKEQEGVSNEKEVAWNTRRDQGAPIFERMTSEELETMCDIDGDQARIKPWLREGITWLTGDAGDPELADALGPQDVVIANRFLCHMEPAAAEKCLRNIASMVKPGGYLFVSGIDLDVRTKVAQSMNWKPITKLMREIHDGDSSIRMGWPLEYWGLEPYRDDKPDRSIRYASVFQCQE